ncbi:MAG TPA: RHS domain-containing protein [Gammaproteobacteria bacterium]|nr:RHS domain-containing protein [Gammaproteobacteria bacterium]
MDIRNRNKAKHGLKWLLVLLCGVSVMFAAAAAYADQVIIYVHTDRLGNPVAKTDSSGAVVWRQSYTPYGETTRQDDPCARANRVKSCIAICSGYSAAQV